MRRGIVAGGILLALSGAVNAIALARLRQPLPPLPRPCVHACREVERTVVEAREAAAPPRPAPSGDPAVESLLAEQETLVRLWERLDHLRAVRAFLTAGKYEEAALRLTIESLRPRAAFEEAARVVLDELRQAARRHEAELARIAADGAPGLGEAYEDERRRARERLSAALGPRPLHALFRERMDEWIAYLLSD